MAIAASTVWECRASGAGVSDNNGGAWAPLTVSTFSGSDLVVDASLNTKVTSVTHNFVAADVGTRIQITGGTGWTTGFYTINSVAANAATLSSSPAAISTTGGVWVEVGQDRGNQNSPQVVIDNSAITTSITANVITFTGYAPTNADVGNVVQMLTGTNVTAGFYQITATTATTWTVTGAVNLPTSGTTTNATGNMGGSLLTLAKLAGALLIGSNAAFCTGAFSSNATTTFAPAGVTPSGTAPLTRLIGYGSTRGDAVKATLTLTTNTGLIGISSASAGFMVENFSVDCANLGTSTAIQLSGSNAGVSLCKVANFTTRGIQLLTGSTSSIYDCEATGGGSAASVALQIAATGSLVSGCWVHDNQCPGINVTVGTVLYNLVANNTGATSDGIQLSSASVAMNNTVHGNGRDGIRQAGGGTQDPQQRVLANLLTNNVGAGITFATATAVRAKMDSDGNAYFGNGSTRVGGNSTVGVYGIAPYTNVRDVILSASPYVGPTTGANANFTLNNTVGGGLACRGVGVPRTWPGNTGTTAFGDMGAVQSCSPTGVGIVYAV